MSEVQHEEAFGAPHLRRRAVVRRPSRSAQAARRCAVNSKCATTMPMLAQHAGCRDRQSSARPGPAKWLPLEPLVDDAPAIGGVGDQPNAHGSRRYTVDPTVPDSEALTGSNGDSR